MITSIAIVVLAIAFLVQASRVNKIKKNLKITAEAVRVLQKVEITRLLNKLEQNVKNHTEGKKGEKTSRKPRKN